MGYFVPQTDNVIQAKLFLFQRGLISLDRFVIESNKSFIKFGELMKGYLRAEHISLVYSGTNYFDVLESIIDEAKETIHFQTYIFENDETGMRIVNAFKRAAQKGVKIWILVDAFGSNSFSSKVIADLKQEGVHFRKFSPLFSSESVFFGRRLHWKIIVADKNVSLTGGINVANKYNHFGKEGAWLDYAILAKGPACEYLHLLCQKTYRRGASRKLRLWLSSMKSNASQEKRIGFRINDWLKGRNQIYLSYIAAIKNAKSNVTVVSSYFLPGYIFRRVLVKAAKRGVKVNVILAGSSDVSTVRSAEIYLYDFYIRNNINVYEWRNSVMHGKAMMVDREWVTIGSYNINFLSRYISIELNTDVEDKTFANEFADHLDKIIATGCQKIDPKVIEARTGAYYKFKIWMAYNFYRFLMNIFVRERTKK